MTTNSRVLIAVIALTILAGAVVYARDRWYPYERGPITSLPTAGSDIRTEPTDFAEVGTVVFDASIDGPGQRTPILTWGTKRAPLVMDAMSVCGSMSGALPCMAMSISFDAMMEGKTALVEGNRLADGSILVRKIRMGSETDPLHHTAPGDRFISWQSAVTLMRGCEVKMVMQTHALDIYLTMKNGERLRTVEPMIDEVFKTTQEINERCGGIGVATE